MLAVDPLAYLELAGGPEAEAEPEAGPTGTQLRDRQQVSVQLSDGPVNP